MDHPDQVADYVARTVLGEATAPESLAAGAWSTAYALTVAGQAAHTVRWSYNHAVPVFWFDNNAVDGTTQVRDLRAYDADGHELPTGHNEIQVG